MVKKDAMKGGGGAGRAAAHAATAAGLGLLALGAALGACLDARLNLRVMHVALGTAFIVLTVLMLKVQIGRFYREDKGPGDWVAWLHFVIFAFLLFLAARMLRRWGRPCPSCVPPPAVPESADLHNDDDHGHAVHDDDPVPESAYPHNDDDHGHAVHDDDTAPESAYPHNDDDHGHAVHDNDPAPRPLIVTYKGKKYDGTHYVKHHPGRSLIWKAHGRDVEEAWREHGWNGTPIPITHSSAR